MKHLYKAHACTQCELTEASEDFLQWFRTFIGEPTYNEINCEALTRLRGVIATAAAEHGLKV